MEKKNYIAPSIKEHNVIPLTILAGSDPETGFSETPVSTMSAKDRKDFDVDGEEDI